MPRKDGRLTRSELVVAKAYAETGSTEFAAFKAGISPHGAYKALQRPEVQAESIREAQRAISTELLPLAVQKHRRLLTDDRTPANTALGAINLAYKYGLAPGDVESKEPADMTHEELAQALKALERVAADRARDVTPARVDQAAEPGIFD